MHWGNPKALFLLLIIPAALILVLLSKRNHKKSFARFAENRFYDYYFQQFSAFKFNLKNVFLIIALLFLIIAMARPQWDREMQIVQKEGVDIVICMDVSKSMDAADIQPSRIERAKDQISLFIDQLKGDRIAIVTFAGRSFVQCPLTDDYGAAKLFLSLLDTETVTSYGTDIGKALQTSIDVFDQKDKHKIIILVSDGEDLEENAVSIAEEAQKQGAIIYSLGIGSPDGSTIPVTDENGNTVYAKNDQGEIIFSRLNVDILSRIAKATNGRFFPITPQQSEIFQILNEIKTMEKKKIDTRQYSRYKDQYHYFVLAALIFIILEFLIMVIRNTPFERVIKTRR
ncbi:MAG: VWA domain-containing protein [Candidatus Cloacimonetes bacterium]|nr:VWA domain-containing protein [Candidatus Cloacimonadota bacterium]